MKRVSIDSCKCCLLHCRDLSHSSWLLLPSGKAHTFRSLVNFVGLGNNVTELATGCLRAMKSCYICIRWLKSIKLVIQIWDFVFIFLFNFPCVHISNQDLFIQNSETCHLSVILPAMFWYYTSHPPVTSLSLSLSLSLSPPLSLSLSLSLSFDSIVSNMGSKAK